MAPWFFSPTYRRPGSSGATPRDMQENIAFGDCVLRAWAALEDATAALSLHRLRLLVAYERTDK